MGMIQLDEWTRLVAEPYNEEPDCYSVEFRLERWTCVDEWDTEISGFVKWDGCINWMANPNCMAHNCGPEDLKKVLDLLQKVFDLAKEIMGDKCDW